MAEFTLDSLKKIRDDLNAAVAKAKDEVLSVSNGQLHLTGVEVQLLTHTTQQKGKGMVDDSVFLGVTITVEGGTSKIVV